MSLLAQAIRTSVPEGPLGYPPVRVNIQGADGVGKSTFAAKSDDVIFLQSEDGLKYIEAPRLPVAMRSLNIYNIHLLGVIIDALVLRSMLIVSFIDDK